MIDYDNSDFVALVKEKIHSRRDRHIIVDKLVNGLTYPQIAEKYDISERQAKRIVKKADTILVHLITP